jgi:protein-L-isoaspartate O-methyltransferase
MVPRHEFIPDTVWREDEDCDDINDLIPLRRENDPATWLQLAYADQAVITQVDDGEPVGPGLSGHDISSSVSMPTMVARMLTELEVEPGMIVCEIGTGYNAALLATRLGAHQVTTIEVDPRIAGRAKHALVTTGFGGVAVVTGDGA